ncbi:MAG: flagellar biosynthetic protein FliR [Lachnospiraceae bacterium]|nr:flagellar biosynthetic protein FliR [Lachnospiraceae bacterium]
MLSTSFSIYHLEFFLLVFARIAGVVSTAPIYGTRGVPIRVRVGFGLCIGLIVATTIGYTPLEYTTILQFTFLLIKELIVGLSVGLASTLCMSVLNLAGMFIDREIGLTMVTAFDPMTNASTTISADLYNYMVLIIMLCSNMHHFIITAICDSFQVIPVGGAIFDGDAVYAILLAFIQEYFVVAFRIALPIFISITLCNVVLGVLAKTAPQMNMFSVGIELKLILGLLVMVATIMVLPNIADFLQQLTEDIVLSLLKTMY